MNSARPRGSGGDSTGWFAATLAAFKHRGCNLLVTGDVSASVSATATRRLFGGPTADRKRVLAVADADRRNVGRCLPPGVVPSEETTRVIDRRARDALDPERLGDDLDEAVGQLADERPFAPAELRLGVDSITALLAGSDRGAVESFLRTTTALVREKRAIGHYHLRTDDADLARSLAAPFDARIELRQRGTLVPEQRWHLPDRTTDWVRL